MAKYEVDAASYVAFDMEDGDGLASIAKSLATAIGKPKKFVPGFLVASMRMLHASGNATPLLTFMAAADLKTEQLAARMIGALSGVDNKGKPRVRWEKAKGKFNWGAWRVDGTINETAADILTKAHGVHQFDSPTVTKALFPAREKPDTIDAEKANKAARLALSKALFETGRSVADQRDLLEAMIHELCIAHAAASNVTPMPRFQDVATVAPDAAIAH